MLSRRRLAFWVGFTLFGLSERLRAESLDGLAAAVMRASESDAAGELKQAGEVKVEGAFKVEGEHWVWEESELWYWFERESWVDGQWKLSGRTRPVHKHTGRRGPAQEGYLDDQAVPISVRRPRPERDAKHPHDEDDREENEQKPTAEVPSPVEPGQPDPERRVRHGRPPSRWLRSLQSEELKVWLKTIDVPEAGVSGMTFWVHLTRDHQFDPDRIAGLTTEEQAKLHAAAHHGY